MTTTKTLLTAAVAASCVLALGGCGDDAGSDSRNPDPGTATLPNSGATVLVAGETSAVGDDRFAGTPVVANGCLGIESEGKTYLVVWPNGTQLGDGDEIRIDGETMDADSTFTGRGVFVYRQPFPEQFPDIPLTCLGPNQEAIAWVQQIDEISN